MMGGLKLTSRGESSGEKLGAEDRGRIEIAKDSKIVVFLLDGGFTRRTRRER